MSTTTKKNAIRIGKIALALAIVFSIQKALGSLLGEVDLASVDRGWVALALAVTLGYRLANACGWSFVLRALDTRMATLKSLRIWLTSEACRWLPGGVWGYGSRALQAKNHGVPAVTAGASLLLEMLLTIGAWFVTAVVGLVFYRQSFLALIERLHLGQILDQIPTSAIALAVITVALVFVGLFASRRVLRRKLSSKLNPILDRLRLLKQARPSLPGCAFALTYYVAMCFVNGVAAWFVFRAVAPESQIPLLAMIGANAAAWLIGFFAFMAPGGLVVREGALAALLTAWLPAEQAIAAAVIWRLIQIVVEIVCMVAAYAGPWLRSMGQRLVEFRNAAAASTIR